MLAAVRGGIEEGVNSGNWKEALGKTLLGIVAASFTDGLTETERDTGFRGFLGSLFGPRVPGRQTGGPVSARMPYVVGERGPELFIPGQSGFVAANQSLSQRGRDVNVNLNYTNNGVDYGVDAQEQLFNNAGFMTNIVRQQLSELENDA